MNVYEIVTNKIIEQLEKGVAPWAKNWQGEEAINYVTRKPYRGINRWLLPFTGEYLTFNQVQDLKGHIKKGEKANLVVFFKMLETEATETEKADHFPMLRYYNVFHLSQVEGIETKCPAFLAIDRNQIIPNCETVVNAYFEKAKVIFNTVLGSGRAFYSPSNDSITMPDIKQFDDSEGFYSTLFHEIVHSTGHASRLARSGVTGENHFGNKEYSKEELIAELGAAFINNRVGIDNEKQIEHNAAYLQAWIKTLKGDSKLIVSAASASQKACDYVLGTEAAQ